MSIQFLSGLAHELYIASWFAKQGYAIYWPLQTQSRCDLVIEKDNIFQKIQCKKASWSSSGVYRYLQCRLKSRNLGGQWYRIGDYDLMVFTDDVGRIWIAPFEEVNTLISVCLDGTKENYKSRSVKYNPVDWLVLNKEQTH